MASGFDPVEPNGLASEKAKAPPGAGAGRSAPAATGPFWHCPVPTLEGQPRFPLRPSTPAGHESPLQSPSSPSARPAAGSPCGSALASRSEDDVLLRLYLRDALREPPLAPGEESEMAWRASFGDEPGRERLVLGNLRLVLQIASEYQGFGLSLNDLISEGNLGLMRATARFKPTEGVPFRVYAALWVRQHMRRALSRQAWPMGLPADFSWQHNRLRQAEARLSDGSGRKPADEELAAESGFTLGTVRRLRSEGFPCRVSLASPVAGGDNGEVLADTLPDEQTPAPDVATCRRSDCEYVEELLAALKPRERQVLRLRFGLDDGQERTLEEVGLALGYVRQGIHKIESAALARLRRRVTD